MILVKPKRLKAFHLREWQRIQRAVFWGVLARSGSAWVGYHYSPYNRRVCINLVPCVTVWFTLPGGVLP